jgi:DNA-binding IclR family transcriptional regulator
MSHATVARALKKLLDDGLIANDGKGRYTLTTDEPD